MPAGPARTPTQYRRRHTYRLYRHKPVTNAAAATAATATAIASAAAACRFYVVVVEKK